LPGGGGWDEGRGRVGLVERKRGIEESYGYMYT